MDPSVSSTGDGVGFVSVDEETPVERCVRTRGGGKDGTPLVHCWKLEDLGEKLLICIIHRWEDFAERSSKKKML